MDPPLEDKKDENSQEKSFKELGLSDLLIGACRTLKWEQPTEVQLKSIPHILSDNDVVVIAETGCGKTGAYALPILHKLQQRPQRNFALILTPTMELALQVKDQISHLGAPIEARCVALVSKVDIAEQAKELGKKVHIIVATPGRLLDHLKQTTNFNFKLLKYLVLDEADKMLDMDFDSEIDQILQRLPKQRRTLLLSATLTTKVDNLQKASLKAPIKVEVYNKHKTPQSLDNYYVCLPLTFREIYLVEVLRCLLLGNGEINKPCSRVMVFCNTCSGTLDIACMLAHLSFTAFPINGNMAKSKRIEMLDLYKQNKGSILVATDVASRGLDIPDVDAVVNLDLPNYPKEYVHRVGRTARAGKHGIAISFVTGDNISTYLSIERHVKRKFPLYPLEDRKTLERTWAERVSRAKRLALKEVNSFNKRQGLLGKKKSDIFDAEDDETEEAHGVKNRVKKKKND